MTATMPRATPSRKALFKAALAITETTLEQWAASEDITAGHLSHVLAGRKESQSLCEKIDAYIAQHMGRQRVRAG